MLLRVDRLRLSLGGKLILSDVHMELEAGQIYGLLGPNGAGKSTTIAAILGLLRADSGTIEIFDRRGNADAPAVRKRLGVLPEQNGAYDWMTAEDYLTFFASLYGHNFSSSQVAARLANVGLEPRASQAIGTFSRGMCQRLGLARALIGDPDLLILDEPTNGLDPRGRREIHDVLRDLARRGVGILTCTHLLDDVERLCQRIGVIVDGKTVAEGDIGELIRDTGHFSRFRLRLVGELPKDTKANGVASIVAREGDWLIVDVDAKTRTDETWRELLFSGWPIVEIRREGGGLEGLYLSITERKAA